MYLATLLCVKYIYIKYVFISYSIITGTLFFIWLPYLERKASEQNKCKGTKELGLLQRKPVLLKQSGYVGEEKVGRRGSQAPDLIRLCRP